MNYSKDPQLYLTDSGIRLVHLRQPAAGVGIFGIAVRAGSADEDADKMGLAHLVEHTIFKGTARRSSWHIINRMESVGGELNAYTTKEETVVYTSFPAGHLDRAFDLISDLVANSSFPTDEVERERGVVLEEIDSYLDTPSEAVFDDFDELVYA
ncbi:MAG: insulinase family protein, partial [Muribaculaceae bacterium]|nr:insulinase family protein [Muribaculaceae bacterium]